MTQERIPDEQKVKRTRLEDTEQEKQRPAGPEVDRSGLAGLQQLVGNRAVQRLLAQRSGEGPVELDDETAGQINQARGGGQSLDSAVQQQMGEAMGHDFSDVRVHTSPESDDLNRQLSAKAFATGQDVFFREGTYDPHSSDGQELIAHELTHVVQQGTGAVGDAGGRMTVNPPGDAFEQEADAIAKQAAGPPTAAGEAVQRQDIPEEELQTKAVQRQDIPEEEEPVQMQIEEEEEEPVQMQAEEEEEVME